MPKITPRGSKTRDTVYAKTRPDKKMEGPAAWWKASTDDELVTQLLGTAAYLKENQQYRYRQAALYSRLYSNYPLYGWTGSSMSKMAVGTQLPADRSTCNIIQSCIDTKVSRITQSRPRPMFLTDNGNYKERKLSKQLNDFISGEFHQVKAYEHGENILRDGEVLGSGVVKIFRHEDKVKVERRILTELFVDPNDALYGCPRQLYELQLMDRSVVEEMFPKNRAKVSRAEQAYPDNSGDSSKTISDQIMVVESWHLPSGKDATDGRHVIACTSGKLLDEKWTKDRFPFVIDHNSKRMLGFWGQGAAERLTGTQQAINRILQTIDTAINLVGVPRVFVEEGSKVVSAHLNNQVGAIVKFRGTKPVYEVAPCVPTEMYAQLERLIKFAYQQEGVSQLAAQAQKPAGLNSGEAIRNYDDIQSDRFALTQKKYSRVYEDMAYLIFDTACDIAKDTGKYSTVYPNKNGAKQIDLPEIDEEMRKGFVIQCFDSSALPKDPAGRLQKITEMIQAGMLDLREGRRLLDYPDLKQNEELANASEERIYQTLDKIIDDADYNPPDPFMDLQLAKTISVQYYNLYVAAKLEPEKAELLRNFNSQCIALMTQAMQPPPQMASPDMGAQPIGVPQQRPVSDLMPLAPGGAA